MADFLYVSNHKRAQLTSKSGVSSGASVVSPEQPYSTSLEAVLAALDSPIAFHRVFALIAGDACSGLFLSQAWYWSRRTKPSFSWFWKTMEEWEDETFLTRREQETARKRLVSLGLMKQERRGVPARLFFVVDLQAVLDAINGKFAILPPERIVEIYRTELQGLSAAGFARASSLGIKAEKVDYAMVLLRDKALCHLCGLPITRGPGSKTGYLHFDHVVPVSGGGSHTYDNVKCAHSECNLTKGNSDPDCLPEAFQFATGKQTSSLAANKPYKEAESTSESTSDILPAKSSGKDHLNNDGKLFTLTSSEEKVDSLHYRLRKHIEQWYQQENQIPCPWTGAEARQLSSLLKKASQVEESILFRCVDNRFKSDTNQAEDPHRWINSLLRYQKGPLDSFGKQRDGGRPLTTARSANDELERQGMGRMPLKGRK